MTTKLVPEPVQEYLASLHEPEDEVLAAIAAEGRKADLPNVATPTAWLLATLVRAMRATRVLEIGTANGYSGAWVARAFAGGGELYTFEIDPARAETARHNFERAGVASRVNVLVGDAARLVWKVSGPFDLIFQDGDKHLYEPLLDRLHDLLRPGGVMVVDNVLWDGEVIPGFVDPPVRTPDSTRTIAAFNVRLSKDRRFATLWLPIGDGVAVAVKQGASS